MRGNRLRSDPAQLSLFDLSLAAAPSWPAIWTEGELLCFDLETTGVDRFSDVPVSFALVRMRAGAILERTVRIVDPARPIPPEAIAIHGITDERARREGMALDQAVEVVVSALVSASGLGVPVVGIKLDFDLTIVDVLSRARDGRGLVDRGWRGPALDALVLDRHVDPYRPGRRTLVDLCRVYGVTMRQAHSAECDAEAAAAVLLAMGQQYEELSSTSAFELHAAQAEYHRTWAVSYDRWRRSRGLVGLDPAEVCWPLAGPLGSEAGAA